MITFYRRMEADRPELCQSAHLYRMCERPVVAVFEHGVWVMYDFYTGRIVTFDVHRYRVCALRLAEEFTRAKIAQGFAIGNSIDQPAESVAVVEKFIKSGRSYRRLPKAKPCTEK